MSCRPDATAMIWNRALLAALAALALAAGGWVEGMERADITADELMAGTALGVPPGLTAPVADDEVLEVTDDMRAFLEEHVHSRATDQVKLRELIEAIITTKAFTLTFDDRTRTASEAFRLRSGNCLSFSNLFVAMAREVGLKASFQEVDLPPDWTLDKDVFVLNRHVNVRIDLSPLGVHVVDFNIDDFRASYATREIADARARAHYFNNMGVQSMQAGDAATAVAFFRTAIAGNDREFSPAWTNLGTLYMRHGHPAHAEAAYLQALRVNRDEIVAMSNLAGLYERQGDPRRAATYRRRVSNHRMQNPYYRFQRARQAFEAGDFDAAIGHLKFAVRKKRNEDQFCDLLARCYRSKGDERKARYWEERALQAAASDAPRRRYSGPGEPRPPGE
jgi:Flp pilus assembly protein TadD